jgi:hypothetical protein
VNIYFHAFDPNAQPLDQLEYLLFGRAPDLFLAHVITRPPDFDQILGVTIGAPAPAAADLARGLRVAIPGRPNTARTRIKAGEQVSGQVQLPDAQAGQPFELQLVAGTEFYFEEGELFEEASFRQTPEEEGRLRCRLATNARRRTDAIPPGRLLEFCTCGAYCPCQPTARRWQRPQCGERLAHRPGNHRRYRRNGPHPGRASIHGHVLDGRTVVYYVDTASDQQQQALRRLERYCRRSFGDLAQLIGEVVGVERAAITFQVSDGKGSPGRPGGRRPTGGGCARWR